ncbi:metallophosphoesterase [Bhargavaea ullalensis]|uniref:MPP superfamily phosphohydrolase n=1 Tax=Bhargavaea ullalensis TaxID=1265685 RepID=A0ABV2GEX4_9BACL
MKLKKTLVLLAAVLAVSVFLYWDNGRLTVTRHTIADSRLPEALDGLRIVQLSDVHDSEFGKAQEDLVEAVRKERPDCIFITGDFIDSNRFDLKKSMAMIPGLTGIADVFYVTGNHEAASNEVGAVTGALSDAGVHVLRNESVMVGRGDGRFAVTGIDDPLMGAGGAGEDAHAAEALVEAAAGIPEDVYQVLLAHRPEQLDLYAEAGVPLAFSGHAHGGQVRLPFIGGLIAPGQGWLPDLTSGVHEQGGTRIVISRGLGNSIVPLRVLNPPEIVSVTLRREG